uniref:Peptidase A2 domain-containing protein n=1 Tax=Bursaphelenchus xylophilus TaxID=6326 RepID=A0A1I7S1F7_BURXY
MGFKLMSLVLVIFLAIGVEAGPDQCDAKLRDPKISAQMDGICDACAAFFPDEPDFAAGCKSSCHENENRARCVAHVQRRLKELSPVKVKGYDLNNVDDFLKFLYELAAETEKWFFAPGKENVKPQTRSNPVVTPKNHFRIHGSVDTPSGCPFCSENHKASDCSKVKSYDARMQSLKVQRKCYRCFDSNHLSSACEKDFSCRKCGKNHQTFMCPPRRDPPVIIPSNSVPVGDSESNALCFTIVSKSEPPPVFPSKVGTKFLNLFVDCGSDINFMKKSAVISDIPLVFDRNLTVSSFHGSVRVKSSRLNVIFTPNQNQRFKFVPDVPPNQVVFPVHVVDDSFFDRLKGSKFSRDVDVLLGVDAMMALQFTVTESRSDAGYQLVKTSLGYFEAGARSPYTQLHPTNIVPPPVCPTRKCDGTDGKQRRSCPAPEIASGQLMEKSKWPPECHDFACEFAYSHGMTDKLL